MGGGEGASTDGLGIPGGLPPAGAASHPASAAACMHPRKHDERATCFFKDDCSRWGLWRCADSVPPLFGHGAPTAHSPILALPPTPSCPPGCHTVRAAALREALRGVPNHRLLRGGQLALLLRLLRGIRHGGRQGGCCCSGRGGACCSQRGPGSQGCCCCCSCCRGRGRGQRCCWGRGPMLLRRGGRRARPRSCRGNQEALCQSGESSMSGGHKRGRSAGCLNATLQRCTCGAQRRERACSTQRPGPATHRPRPAAAARRCPVARRASEACWARCHYSHWTPPPRAPEPAPPARLPPAAGHRRATAAAAAGPAGPAAGGSRMAAP